MKRTILLLGLVLALLLTACGQNVTPPAATPTTVTPPAETPAETPAVETPDAAPGPAVPAPEEQRRVLEENRGLWTFDWEGWTPDWYYAFTDLDHNGLLEVLAASTQGSGIYTYAHYYEVLPDGSGVRNLYHEGVEVEGIDDWPEIVAEALTCYYDSETDRYHYVCENLIRDGAAHTIVQLKALCLKDGVAEWEPLAELSILATEEGERTWYWDAAGEPITEEEYQTAAERRFAGMERSELRPDWNAVTSPEPEPGRADGERFETVIRIEGMDETVWYEHIRNEALGFEMDYDFESLTRRSEADRERFISIYDDPDDPWNYLEVTRTAEDAETAAATVRAALSEAYELTESTRELEYAGVCLRIEASVIKGTNLMADQLQGVYIIPAGDGCLLVTEHTSIESAEGFGRRFSYLIDTIRVISD
ncbi:MAG: hypothetical protein IJR65_00015 [Oscillospiraceae bacterium]|nr:hypothetical protein [Oscillospiraceae bacterium]